MTSRYRTGSALGHVNLQSNTVCNHLVLYVRVLTAQRNKERVFFINQPKKELKKKKILSGKKHGEFENVARTWDKT